MITTVLEKSTSTELLIIALPLAELALHINLATKHAEASARSAVQFALEAGNLLNRAKAMTERGQWESWLTQHCDVAPRTAQAYMRLANKLPHLSEADAQRVADLPLRDAIKAIATDPVTPPRHLSYKATDLSEAHKAGQALASGARALRSISRDVEGMRALSHKRVASLREKLLSVVALLDQVGGTEC